MRVFAAGDCPTWNKPAATSDRQRERTIRVRPFEPVVAQR
jgi:hypothetical protein